MKGTLAWAFTTWLTLIAVQALTTRTAPGRVADLFADIDHLLERALDPTVPAIPDRRTSTSGTTSSTSTGVPFTGGTTYRSTTSTRLPVPGTQVAV